MCVREEKESEKMKKMTDYTKINNEKKEYIKNDNKKAPNAFPGLYGRQRQIFTNDERQLIKLPS